MAILFVESLSNNNNRVLQIAVKTLEIVLLSAGLISTILMVKGAVLPYSCEFVFSSLIGIWNSIKCFLSSPLYICIIINFMVVLIAFSSTFHLHETTNQDGHGRIDIDYHDIVSIPPPPAPPPSPSPSRDITEVTPTLPPPSQDVTEVVAVAVPVLQNLQDTIQQNCIDKRAYEIKKTTYSLGICREMDHSDKENEEMDTIEDTWKAITGEGKQRPKEKQLKKSETWNVHVPPRVQRLDSEELVPSNPKWKELRKLETFNDAVSVTRRGGLRRDPSVGIDEFNKQVDDFIKKFNDNMRLQRQESDQRFMEMVKQGL